MDKPWETDDHMGEENFYNYNPTEFGYQIMKVTIEENVYIDEEEIKFPMSATNSSILHEPREIWFHEAGSNTLILGTVHQQHNQKGGLV